MHELMTQNNKMHRTTQILGKIQKKLILIILFFTFFVLIE